MRDINADMTQHMLRLTCRILFGLEDQDLAYRVGEMTERWVALNHRIGPAAFTPNAMLTAGYDELLQAAEELESTVKEMLRRKREGRLGHDVMSLLIDRGADISFADPHVATVRIGAMELERSDLTAEAVAEADLCILLTDHSAFDLQMVADNARLIVDTRNGFKGIAADSIVRV